MQKKLRWLVKEPAKSPEIQEFVIDYDDANDLCSKELKLAQKLVCGYVEVCQIAPGVTMLLNEEGIMQKLPDNCGFLGTLVFVGTELDTEGEETWSSLDDENLRKCKVWLKTRENLKGNKQGGFSLIPEDKVNDYFHELDEYKRAKEEEWDSL